MQNLILWLFNPRKMIRKFLFSSIFALAAGFFTLQFFSQNLIASAISKAIGVPVQIGRMHFSLSPFEAGIYQIRIKNPSGYSEKYLTTIPEVFVRVKLSSIFKRLIQIEKITLNLEEITVERNKQGKVSLQEVLKNIQTKTPGPSSRKKPQPEGPKQPPAPQKSKPSFFKTQIDEVVLSVNAVRYVDSASEPPVIREIRMDIRELRIKDVLDIESLAEQIIGVILEKIGMRIIGVQIDKLADNIQNQASQMMGQAKEKLSSLFR